MGIHKITFDGANVTSKIDADLYHFLFSSQVGVFKGLKNSCSYSLFNNTITFSDGYIVVYGRIVYLENGTSVLLSPDSSKFGYVVLKIDTVSNSISIYNKEQVGNYPALTQDNLILQSGVYEYALCAYSKTTTSITINSTYKRDEIVSNKSERDKIKTDLSNQITNLENKLTFQKMALNKVSNGVYRFAASYSDISSGLFNIIINNSIPITIAGLSLFETIGSERNISYNYLGTNYSLFIEYTTSTITMTCGSTSHSITLVYMFT